MVCNRQHAHLVSNSAPVFFLDAGVLLLRPRLLSGVVFGVGVGWSFSSSSFIVHWPLRLHFGLRCFKAKKIGNLAATGIRLFALLETISGVGVRDHFRSALHTHTHTCTYIHMHTAIFRRKDSLVDTDAHCERSIERGPHRALIFSCEFPPQPSLQAPGCPPWGCTGRPGEGRTLPPQHCAKKKILRR